MAARAQILSLLGQPAVFIAFSDPGIDGLILQFCCEFLWEVLPVVSSRFLPLPLSPFSW